MVTTALPFISWWERHRRQLACIGAGHLCYASFNWSYDQILYVFIVYRLGLIVGGALMTMGSILQCSALLLAYQRMKIEWVGAASIHSLAFKKTPSFIETVLVWAMQKGTIPIFFALCVFQDPFITTAYFKRGRFDGLSRQDWQVFFASVLVSNGYWTLRSGLIANILVRVCRCLHGEL